MPHAVFRFPGGRYHGTPWQSHVNEGAVEWPPSPWRLCRALMATGYTKLGWDPWAIPDTAVSLIEALARTLPVYRVPPASVSHTRHYMPIAGQKTSKVFDTFAYVGGGALGVSWNVELHADQLRILERLLSGIGYLGRAESWVAAELVPPSSLPDNPVVQPSGAAELVAPGWEQVALIAPSDPGAYQQWREMSVASALEREAERRGRSLTAAQRAKVESRFPANLWDCLTARTAALRKQGWSQPPGSRYVFYSRPAELLSTAVRVSRPLRPGRQAIECALLALASNTSQYEVLPLMGRCVPQAELIHRSLVALSRSISGHPCPELSGRDESGQPLAGHRHVHHLPLDLDGDSRMDHVLLHAPMGFGDDAQYAIERLERTWTKGHKGDLFVSLVGTGSRADVRQALGGADLLGLSAEWVSYTPFVAPRHIKRGRHSLENQVRAELAERGFPEPTGIEVGNRESLTKTGFLRFVRERRDQARKPPTTQPWQLRLRFPTAVPGPIALGYACHFGLGVFKPL